MRTESFHADDLAKALRRCKIERLASRSAYREKGLDYALRDARRSGAPRKYRPDQAQAEVAAVACSQPPPGCQAMDRKAADRSCGATRGLGRHQSGERAPASKKTS